MRSSLTEAPSLHRHYPASLVLRASPPPHTRPGLSLASCQLIDTAITAAASPVASGLLCLHAIAITPAGSMELVRSSLSIDCGLPCVKARSAPATIFPGPAQRLLTLWPARSRSRHATLSIEKLRQLRCLRCRFDCYRVERTSSRTGVSPAEVQRLFTAHYYAS